MKPRICSNSITCFTVFTTALVLLLNASFSHALKCFACEFNINYCKTPDCYHNPDICSANQFSNVLVPIQECPRNCMLKAVTNPAGIVLKWKRLCAPASDLTHGFRCRIDYVFGARIEQCTCDKDFCNGTTTLSMNGSSWTVLIASILVACYSLW